MSKRKTTSKIAKEIAVTSTFYIVLCLLSYFFVGKFITVSDQGLSAIGAVLTSCAASLTAIIISFTLIIWQFSRKDRFESFIHFRETKDKLEKVYIENIGSLHEMFPELERLLFASSRVSLINPMPSAKIAELFGEVETKLKKETEKGEKEEVKICEQISNLLTPLLSYGMEHTTSDAMYLHILNLRKLLYRLLVVLIGGISVVALANTATSIGLSDAFNLPLAVTLFAWFIYVLVSLANEIKNISWLEDELRNRRKDKLEEWQSF